MKFGQLIEYSMRNIFLEKSYTKCGRETIPSPFLKNQHWAYLWINVLKFYIFCFNCLPSWGYRRWLKLSCRLFAFTSYKAFLKIKKSSETSLLPHFLDDFWRKTFMLFYSITWPNVRLPLLREILGNMCIVIVC